MKKLKRLVIVMMTQVAILAAAQANAPSTPDNVLTTADSIGLPPHASADGASEVVNLSSGSLHMFIPAITLPQRGGKPLVLGFSYDSNQISLQQNVFVGIGSNDDFNWDYYTYSEELASTNFFNSPLQVNLPILQASAEYEGDGSIYVGTSYSANGTIIYPAFCLTNFSFRDWGGTTHAFAFATALCPIQSYAGQPGVNPVPEVLDDLSADGTHYLLHLGLYGQGPWVNNDPGTITITAPDGIIYTWPGQILAAYLGSMNNGLTGNIEQLLNIPPSSIVDPNGNTTTIGQTALASNIRTYNITDTVGRQVTVIGDFNGAAGGPAISYKDSNGAQQTVSLTQTSVNDTSTPDVGSDLPWLSSCYVTNNFGNPPPAPQYTMYPLNATGQPPQTGVLSTYGLSYSGTGRTFTLQLDGLGHLVKIQYPSGGYTRYDYKENIYQKNSGPVSCVWGLIEVNHKYECPNASGSCTQENTTTYDNAPAPIVSGSAVCPGTNTLAPPPSTLVSVDYLSSLSFDNNAMKVTDPLGTITVHCFTAVSASPYMYIPGETDTYIYSSNSSLLKHINQTVNGYGWPGTTTATYQDVQPNLSSKVVYTYDSSTDIPSVPGSSIPQMQGPQGIENATDIKEYDFSNSLVRETRQSWNYVDHVLNRPLSTTKTDMTTGSTSGLSITTGYTYDSKNNPQSMSKSGTNATGQSATGALFDSFGRPQKITDGLGYSTLYSYTDNWNDRTCAPSSNSQAYLTSITNAKSQTTTYSYNSCTGTVAGVTDPNGKTTSVIYDAIGRVTAVSYPDSGWEHDSYVDTAPNSVLTTKTQSPDPDVSAQVVFDGYSRKSQSQLLTDPNGVDYTDTTYDAVGRVASTSNPYRSASDPTYGITYNYYDALNRKTIQTEPDGSKLQWCYDGTQDPLHPQSNCNINSSSFTSGTWVDSADESGNNWQHITDSLGRLRSVVEPYELETNYSYDAFGSLWAVNQKGLSTDTPRSRSFVYSGLSQLIQSYNPETGYICYGSTPGNAVPNGSNCTQGYDADGNLSSKIDARGTVTNFHYDNLNRLTAKSYLNDPSSSPASCYAYDVSGTTNGVGRLGAQWTQKTSCSSTPPTNGALTQNTIAAYDPMGRITTSQQCVWTNCTAGTPFSLTQSYDLAGNLKYWDNGIVSQPIGFGLSYDGAGRLAMIDSSWNDGSHPQNLFSVQTFSPSGALLNWMLGNNLDSTRTYDPRLRVTSETVIRP